MKSVTEDNKENDNNLNNSIGIDTNLGINLAYDFKIEKGVYIDIFFRLLKKIKNFIYNLVQDLVQDFFKIGKKVLIVFIIFNAIFFPILALSQLNKKYPVQSAVLMCSHMITRLYILPLSSTFGYHNILTLPFYAVRTPLYKVGIHFLPQNAPERMVWWYNTRFLEYAAVLTPTNDKRSFKRVPYTKMEIFNTNKWNDEVYEHILLFPNTDLSETIYKNNQIQIYRDLIEHYTSNTYQISLGQQITTPLWLNLRERDNCPKLPGAKYDAVKHNIELIKSFDALKSKVAKDNPKAYQKYLKEPVIEEYIFKNHVLERYLRYKETYEKIDCDSEEFLLFQDMRFKTINYIIQYGDNCDPKDVMWYQMSLITAVNTDVCPECYEKYSKEREKLSQYFIQRNERAKKRKSNKK